MDPKKPKMSKEDLVQRIATDVGLCWAAAPKDPISILCDLLYFTNLHSKWHEDVVTAIVGIYPKYFEKDDK